MVVDAATGLTRWACIGTGAVDYAGQIAALRRDGYRGAPSVETHWRKPGDTGPGSIRDTLAGLMRTPLREVREEPGEYNADPPDR